VDGRYQRDRIADGRSGDAVAVAPLGQIVITGDFPASATFDDVPLEAYGLNDIFIWAPGL